MVQAAIANDTEDQLRAQLSALQPPRAPQLSQVPTKAPPPILADPLKAMSGPMMLLATLGGALTGAPITSALNNASGFLHGVAQGNDYATQQKLKEFNTNVDAATKANKTAVEQYNLDLLQYQNDAGKLHQALLSTAVSHGDDMVKAIIESGDVKSAVTLIDARERSAQMLQLHKDNLNLANDRLLASSLGQPQMVETKDGKQVLAQQDKAGLITGKSGQWVTADENHTLITGVTGAVSSTTAGLPQANQGMAAMIASYALPPLSGYALRQASGQQIMADVQKINPSYNAANYDRIKKTIDDFATGPSSKRIVSLNVAIQHLHVLQDLSDALQSGDARSVNAAKQEFAKQFGEAAPTNFDAVVQIVGKEVVKAIVNGGGGVTERNEAQNAFSRVSSPQQMSGAINSVKKILAGQLAGLRQQYSEQTNGAPGVIPFSQLLLPDTKQELGNLANTSAQAPSNVGASKSFNYTDKGELVPSP